MLLNMLRYFLEVLGKTRNLVSFYLNKALSFMQEYKKTASTKNVSTHSIAGITSASITFLATNNIHLEMVNDLMRYLFLLIVR